MGYVVDGRGRRYEGVFTLDHHGLGDVLCNENGICSYAFFDDNVEVELWEKPEISP